MAGIGPLTSPEKRVKPTPAQVQLAKPFFDNARKIRGQQLKLEADLAEAEKMLQDMKSMWSILDEDLDPALGKKEK